MFSDCLWRHLRSLKEFLGMLHQLLRKYEQIKQMPTQWCVFFPLWSCRVWLVLPAPLVPRCQCCLCILCSRRNAACGSVFLKQEHCLLSSERAVGEWGRQRLCVPRQFYVVCLWWKMGWFTKGREERADVNTGESARAEMTLAHFSPESNQVLLVYLVSLWNGWKS